MNPTRDHRSQTLPATSGIHLSQSSRSLQIQTETPATSDTSIRPDSRLVLKSNWFMLFTRRKRQPTKSVPEPLPQDNVSNEESSTTGSKSFGEYSGTRHRKHSIMYAFNKCLKLGPKSTRRSTSVPVNLTTAAQPDRDLSLEPIESNCTESIVHTQTAAVEIPNSSSTVESKSDPITVWLDSLSEESATVYRAKIAMNPFEWYRGGMSRDVAQKKLQGQPNGSFLVRDSQTSGCHFTLSFRSAGITLHYRIENADGLWIIESCRNASMVGLIEHAKYLSNDQILCYVKPSSQLQQPFPVRLTNSISKFDEVPSLQHICRYVARSHLPDPAFNYLPIKLREFVRHKPFLGRKIGYFET